MVGSCFIELQKKISKPPDHQALRNSAFSPHGLKYSGQ
ncbi:hypothetical protein LEP1GSC018_4073 [Leptospira kirschneri str. 2008720114]|nr:hypothetical protein LEP1GSC018_4073 [Leptospira kirschneri str. 2008720114]EMK06784.1 hypothetical protein LEP1GSC176_2048 [Leptospira kirschneri str. MMD1493]